ncbi:MAG: hypothetical protein WCG01_03985 [bacterium]
MKSVLAVMLVVFSLVLFGCGGGGSISDRISGGQTPSTSGSGKVVLLSAVAGPSTGQTTYVIKLPKSLVYGSRANPFISTDLNGFTPVPLTQSSSDGLDWIATIVTYDMIVKVKYGGDNLSTPISFADMTLEGSGYYNATVMALEIGFNAGKLYTVALMPPPVSPPADIVSLVSAVQDPVTKRYRYKWTMDMTATSGANDAPFISGDFNGWKNEPMSVNAGFGVYSTSSYNKLTRFTYGGSAVANSYANATNGKSGYWDNSNNIFVVGMKDGTFLKQSAFLPVAYGGTATDTGNVVGFTLNAAGDSLTIYFNLEKVGGSIVAPFWDGAYYNWVPQPITVIDANGWASATIPVTQPIQLVFGFGGDIAQKNYGDITKSQYFRATYVNYTNVIAVDVRAGAVTLASPLVIQ